VVRAAMTVADREGLGSVTMARVAAELGVTTMALYRHVPGKDVLVDLMTDAAFAACPEPAGGGWRDLMAGWARAELALFQRHPWLQESVMSGTSVGPNWLGWIESALRALAHVPLAPREKVSVMLLVDGHVRATAQISTGAKSGGEWAENFRRALEYASSTGRFRALANIAATGGFAAPTEGRPSGFEFGLARLLDGVAAYCGGRKPTGRPRGPRPAPDGGGG
jgi:AcrR family transcriptional regulator